MGAYRFFKGGGNYSLKEGKIGFMGKDREMSPGKALPMVRRGRVLDKWVPLFSRLTAKVL